MSYGVFAAAASTEIFQMHSCEGMVGKFYFLKECFIPHFISPSLLNGSKKTSRKRTSGQGNFYIYLTQYDCVLFKNYASHMKLK